MWFRALGCLGLELVSALWSLGFFRLRVVSCLGLVKVFYVFEGFRFLTVLRFFVVRVYIRVSYGCVEFRLFGGLEDFGT